MMSNSKGYLITKVRSILAKHPIIKGMLSYGTLWPTACLIQQTAFEGKTFETIDWKRCLKYCIFGGLYTAPTVHIWIRFSHTIFPKTGLQIGIKKALVDQFAYGPFAISSFYIGMTLLDGQTFDDAMKELKLKFFPTWKVGAPVWFVLQTVNFAYVPQRHRVVYMSFFSLLWSTFLAYMKHREAKLLLESPLITNSLMHQK